MRRIFAATALLLAPATALAQVSPSPYTTGTRYDIEGRVTGVISPDPDGIGAGTLNFPAVRNTYDQAGRLIKVESGELAAWQSEAVAPSAWPGFTILKTVETSYDALDRKLVDKVRGSVASGNAIHMVTQYSYDGDGRLECTAVRMNPGQFGSLPASACSLGTEGSQGPDRIAKNIYDAAGQLLQVKEGLGTSVEATVATYTYSPNGNKLTLADGKGNLATFEYDPFDRQVAWRFPSAANGAVSASCNIGTISEVGGITGPAETRNSTDDCEKYAHDRNGNRMKLIKRDGSVLRYAYDALNRMTVKQVPERACPQPQCLTAAQTRDVFYDYDLRGLMTKARFDSLSGADGVTSGYNGFGDLTSSSIAMGGTTRALTNLYDDEGKRTRLTHDAFGSTLAQSFTYARDGLGRVSAIYEGTSAVASARLIQTNFNNRGMVAGVQRSDTSTGLNSSFNYDSIGRLEKIVNDANGTAADLTIDGPVNSAMGYNAASQITGQRRSNDSYSWTGSVAVNRNYTTNGLNQYIAAGPAGFGYDLNGNLTSDGATSFIYDVENRLISASGAKTANMTYDPMGRLWQVTGTGTNTRFLYDGDQLVAEYDSNGTIAKRYVHSDNVDDPAVQYNGAAVGAANRIFLMPDERGSIAALFDNAGNSQAINRYDEYGIPQLDANQANLNTGRFQYTGQIWMSEVGMYYYKARIYSPTLGRFLQTDPVGYEDQTNLYAYVRNDPINGMDPTGMIGEDLEDPKKGTRTPIGVTPQKDGSIRLDRYDGERVTGTVVLAPQKSAGGAPAQVPARMQDGLLEASGQIGETIKVHGGTRTPEQNRDIGGAPNSEHLTTRGGNAADITIDGYTGPQAADAVARTGIFNRVNTYTNKDGSIGRDVHVDFKATGSQGRLHDFKPVPDE